MPETLDNEHFRLLLGALPGKAIGYLYEHYYGGLINLALKFTRSRDASEDIVQEAFVHVWENHKKLSNLHEVPIQFYLIRIVKNRSISYYKRTIRLQESYNNYLNGSPVQMADATEETRIIDAEIAERIRALIETFPPREKQCLKMRVNDLMSNKAIASELGITVKAVERSITSANKRLRKWAKAEK